MEHHILINTFRLLITFIECYPWLYIKMCSSTPSYKDVVISLMTLEGEETGTNTLKNGETVQGAIITYRCRYADLIQSTNDVTKSLQHMVHTLSDRRSALVVLIDAISSQKREKDSRF